MKRRTMLTIAAVALLFVLSAGAAFALVKTCGGGDCVGTQGDDELTGTTNPDRIAGLEGNDQITQPGKLGDSDEMFGGGGDDTIIDKAAGADNDTIFGDAGNDTIDVREEGDFDASAGDFVDCGPGKKDTVFFNDELNEGKTLDTVIRCEKKNPGL